MSHSKPHVKQIINRVVEGGKSVQYRITAVFGRYSWTLSHNAMKAHTAFDGVQREKGRVNGRWCVFVPLVAEPCEPTWKGRHLVYLP